MANDFYTRLKNYYISVGKVLKGEADAAAIFPNPSDIGLSREKVYIEFLRQHVPSKCNVFLGGFLFGTEGEESKQLDVIITNDTSPRFSLNAADHIKKSFAPVEGCLGVVSVKSKLDKEQLIDALKGIASIPLTASLENRVNPLLEVKHYEDWPFKIIYATDGLKSQTIISHLNEFYAKNQEIPITRKPDIIHVVGKYFIMRTKSGMGLYDLEGKLIEAKNGEYCIIEKEPDVSAIMWTINELQQRANISSQIIFNYNEIIKRVSNKK